MLIKCFEELESFLEVIMYMAWVTVPTLLIFFFHLYLLKRTFKIEINNFFRNSQNTPLFLLWCYFSLFTGMGLMVWIFYITGYKPLLEMSDLNTYDFLDMNVIAFSGVVITFILWSLSRYRKISFIASIGIALLFLFIFLKKGFHGFLPSKISFPLTIIGWFNCVLSIQFLVFLLKEELIRKKNGT